MGYLKKRLTTYVAPLVAIKGDIQNPIVDTQITESAVLRENKLFANLKATGLRSIENDYYEYQMRLNNVEDELDALQLLREINNRMSALDNYLASPKIPEVQRKKYLQLYNAYFKLREELSKKKIWKKSNYGLFYNYNDLSPAQMQSYEPV